MDVCCERELSSDVCHCTHSNVPSKDEFNVNTLCPRLLALSAISIANTNTLHLELCCCDYERTHQNFFNGVPHAIYTCTLYNINVIILSILLTTMLMVELS